MKKRTVQILRAVITMCLVLAVTLIPCVVFANSSSSSAVRETVADETTVWRYLDNNTDPTAGLKDKKAWTALDFDDSGWKTAAGKFGSNGGQLIDINGSVPTVLLPLKPDGSDANCATYFFRTKFTVDDLNSVHALSFNVNGDDAVIVYLNGTPISDTRSTNSTETTNIYYSYASTNKYDCWLNADEVKQLLREGENVIAVELHNSNSTSNDIYFELNSYLYLVDGDIEHSFDDVIIGVGSDESCRTFTWYTTHGEDTELQLGIVDDNGNVTDFMCFDATVERADSAPCEFANKATVTGLLENTEYGYRFRCGDAYSETYRFKTGTYGDKFDFVVFGDPQIRSYSNVLSTTDRDFWLNSLKTAKDNFNAEFYVSLGDQVNTSNNESEYDDFIASDFSSIALAPVIGNHDIGGNAFIEHFNLPNASNSSYANYWFTYNGVLFIGINSFGDITTNLSFIEDVVNQNVESSWQILMMHSSPFSSGSHYNNSDVTDLRDSFVPYLSDYGIDLVLGGHDHIYTRTLLMDGASVAEDQSTTDTDSILYLCSGTSGGKYYDNSKVDPTRDFIAYTYYEQNRTLIHFEASENKLSFKTYLIDTMTVIDSFELTNTDEGKLSDAIDTATAKLTEAESKLPESYLSGIKAAIANAEKIKASIAGYSSEDINAAIELIAREITALSIEIKDYDTLSAGAKVTKFDTKSGVKKFHLKDGGVYTITPGGSKVDISIIEHLPDGTEATVFTWKEGSTYDKNSDSNPHVALILDGDVTIEGMLQYYYTNLLIDLNGHTITFNTDDKEHIYLYTGASIEFRGEGTIVAGTGSVSYFLLGATYMASATFNGDITFVDGTSSLKNVFLFKGDSFIYGSLTIDSSYDSSSGIFFGMQGSRSSADDRHANLLIENATINYNNPKGASLFVAKGIRGEYNGVIYESIPELNIIGSRINLGGTMITSKWGEESVSGYANTTSEALTNCVNVTVINIVDSYIYSDVHNSAAVIINPSGHTTLNITNSTLYAEHGVIIRGIANHTLDINAKGSIFFADTDDATASTLGTELGLSSYTVLRGEVLLVPAGTLGTATFDNCSLSSAYRVIEGTSDTLSKRTYFTFLNNSSIIMLSSGHALARVNVVVNGGLIDCKNGKLSNNATPYDPETGKGLLVMGTVTIINFPSSGLDDEITTISAYKDKAATNSAIYTTTLTSGYFTVADDFIVRSITHENNMSGKYAFLLYSETHDPILTVTKGIAPTCYEGGTNDYYTCFCGDIFADAEGTIPIEDLEAYLPASALGHTAGEVVKENEIKADCVNSGSYDGVEYCIRCAIELSREHFTVDALGHKESEIFTENDTLPDCTNDGGYDNVVYCTVCDSEISRKHVTIDALGHTESTWITDIEASCLIGGSMHKVCTVCGDTTTTIDTPALGHSKGEEVTENNVDPTCTESGIIDTVVYCTACNAELSRESSAVKATGHTGGTASCAEPKKCDVCGEYYGDKLEHSYTNYTTDGNANCTDSGTKTAYCDHGCGVSHTIDDPDSALGHSLGKWSSNGDGTHTRVCSRDSEHTETANCYGGTASADSHSICSACGGEYGKTAETPDEPGVVDCNHMCHSDNPVQKILWSIIRFFIKLFGMNDTCPCGTKHY